MSRRDREQDHVGLGAGEGMPQQSAWGHRESVMPQVRAAVEDPGSIIVRNYTAFDLDLTRWLTSAREASDFTIATRLTFSYPTGPEEPPPLFVSSELVMDAGSGPAATKYRRSIPALGDVFHVAAARCRASVRVALQSLGELTAVPTNAVLEVDISPGRPSSWQSSAGVGSTSTGPNGAVGHVDYSRVNIPDWCREIGFQFNDNNLANLIPLANPPVHLRFSSKESPLLGAGFFFPVGNDRIDGPTMSEHRVAVPNDARSVQATIAWDGIEPFPARGVYYFFGER